MLAVLLEGRLGKTREMIARSIKPFEPENSLPCCGARGHDGPRRLIGLRLSRPEGAKSPWTELAFADHPLVPVHFVFDSIMRRIALAEQNANDFKATLGGMLDTPLWEEFHRLANVVFVL
jgi:hypothetical protein